MLPFDVLVALVKGLELTKQGGGVEGFLREVL